MCLLHPANRPGFAGLQMYLMIGLESMQRDAHLAEDLKKTQVKYLMQGKDFQLGIFELSSLLLARILVQHNFGISPPRAPLE